MARIRLRKVELTLPKKDADKIKPNDVIVMDTTFHGKKKIRFYTRRKSHGDTVTLHGDVV